MIKEVREACYCLFGYKVRGFTFNASGIGAEGLRG